MSRAEGHGAPTRYVISGKLLVGTGPRADGARARSFPASSFIVVPAGLHYFAWAEGLTVVQVHGVGPDTAHYLKPDSSRARD
jgi:hypothetical protein